MNLTSLNYCVNLYSMSQMIIKHKEKSVSVRQAMEETRVEAQDTKNWRKNDSGQKYLL